MAEPLHAVYPGRPHPLFRGFVNAAKDILREGAQLLSSLSFQLTNIHVFTFLFLPLSSSKELIVCISVMRI